MNKLEFTIEVKIDKFLLLLSYIDNFMAPDIIKKYIWAKK